MFCLFALAGSAQTGRVFFQTTTFGIVGLARNQVARLNALNPGNAYGDRNAVCSADLQFVDDQGRELKSTSSTQIEWGRAASLELPAKEVLKGTLRIEIRGVIKTAINRPSPSTPSPVMSGAVCTLLPTLEVFDEATGQTQFVLSEGRSIILNTPSKNSLR